jgi:Icc-related predicted phosphoesterase
MKVLASADVHGKWPVYEWLLAIVREHSVDAMILGGDLLGARTSLLRQRRLNGMRAVY